MLLVSHWNGRVAAWNLNSDSPTAVAVDLSDQIWAAALSPAANRAIAVSNAGSVLVVDVQAKNQIGVPYRGSANVQDLAISPAENLFAIGTSTGEIVFIDANTSQPIGQPLKGNSPIHFVRFSQDGQFCFAGDDDRVIWRVSVPQPVEGTVPRTVKWVERMTGLSLGEDGTIRVLDSEEWLQRLAAEKSD